LLLLYSLQVWSQCGDVVVVANEKAKREYELSAEYGQTAKGGRATTTQTMGSHRAAKKILQQHRRQQRSAVAAAAGQHKEQHVAAASASVVATTAVLLLPSGAKHLCTADSLGLDVRDCDAWVALYDAFNGEEWPETWRAGCGTNPDRSLLQRLSVLSGSLFSLCVCVSCRAVCTLGLFLLVFCDILLAVTFFCNLGQQQWGVFDAHQPLWLQRLLAEERGVQRQEGPEAHHGDLLAGDRSEREPRRHRRCRFKVKFKFKQQVSRKLLGLGRFEPGTDLTGSLPSDLFAQDQLSAVQMVWLDHNPGLGGEIPESLSLLPDGQVTAFELHGSAFQGGLPADVAWTEIADCTLNGLVFDCPLPEGAETCGAACA